MKKLLFILTFLSVFGWVNAQTYYYCSYQYDQYWSDPGTIFPLSVDVSYIYQYPGSNNDLDRLALSICPYGGSGFITEDGKVIVYTAEMSYYDYDDGTLISVDVHTFDGLGYGVQTGSDDLIIYDQDGFSYLFSYEFMSDPGFSVDVVYCDQAVSSDDGSTVYTEWSMIF